MSITQTRVLTIQGTMMKDLKDIVSGSTVVQRENAMLNAIRAKS